MNKLLNKGISGFILHLNSLSLQAPHSSAPPAISALLQQYSEVFQEPTTLPPHRDIDHAIPLQEGATPPNIRPYRVPYKQKDEMEHQIQQLLKNKVIRHSQSPYASPAILIKKKDSSWRLCIDYRKLNSQTIKNQFPIPVIEDLLDELYGAKVFSLRSRKINAEDWQPTSIGITVPLSYLVLAVWPTQPATEVEDWLTQVLAFSSPASQYSY